MNLSRPRVGPMTNGSFQANNVNNTAESTGPNSTAKNQKNVRLFDVFQDKASVSHIQRYKQYGYFYSSDNLSKFQLSQDQLEEIKLAFELFSESRPVLSREELKHALLSLGFRGSEDEGGLDYGPQETRVTDDAISKIFADPEWNGRIDLDAFTRLVAVMLASEGPAIASRKAFNLLCQLGGTMSVTGDTNCPDNNDTNMGHMNSDSPTGNRIRRYNDSIDGSVNNNYNLNDSINTSQQIPSFNNKSYVQTHSSNLNSLNTYNIDHQLSSESIMSKMSKSSKSNNNNINNIPGYLDESTLRKLARDLNLVNSNSANSVLTEDDIRRIIDVWDKDSDGVIGESDFYHGMTERMLPD